MKLLPTIFLTLCTIIFFTQSARADLGITPTLLTFEDGERFEHVTLINNSDEAKTYAMSWRFFKMNEKGSPYTPIEKSQTEFDVSKAVFFTPRRVTIPAQRPQKIKLALRRPKDIPPGDYHAHLQFSPVTEVAASVDESGVSEEQRAKTGVAINVGYSIPIIVRVGNVDQGIKIGQVTLKRNDQGALVATVPLTRKAGPYGAMAHMFVYHVQSGDEEMVGEVSNANIFPEVNRREIDVRLTKDVKGGQLKVKLVQPHDKSQILDEEIFPLN